MTPREGMGPERTHILKTDFNDWYSVQVAKQQFGHLMTEASAKKEPVAVASSSCSPVKQSPPKAPVLFEEGVQVRAVTPSKGFGVRDHGFQAETEKLEWTLVRHARPPRFAKARSGFCICHSLFFFLVLLTMLS